MNMQRESHPFLSILFTAFIIPGISALLILISGYTIKAYVHSDWTPVIVVLAAICISLAAFIFSACTKKSYTGKAFDSKKEFGRKIFVAVVVAAVFSFGVVMFLGAYISNNAPIFVTIGGHSYTDNDVLVKYIIADIVIYVIIVAISFTLGRGG